MKLLLILFFALATVDARVYNQTFPPYIVKLEVTKDGQCSVCSGSFIADEWIMTAAHCVYGMDSVVAFVGPPFEGVCSAGYNIKREDIIIHESYHLFKYYSQDLALIEFNHKTPCNLKQPARFIEAGAHTEFYRHEPVSYVRFTSSCGQPASMSIHTLFSDLHCPSGVIWARHNGPMDESVLCVAVNEYDGSCDGDASPHLIWGRPEDELIGILRVPKGKDCGRSNPKDFDIIFTHVYSLKDWVLNTIKTKRAVRLYGFMAKLDISKGDQCSVCSGSFIAKNWILTAAQCVNDADSVTVQFVQFPFITGCAENYTIGKSEIHIHPLFIEKKNEHGQIIELSHDIALMKFDHETSCEHLSIVSLPGDDVHEEFYYSKPVSVARFGSKCGTSYEDFTYTSVSIANRIYCSTSPTITEELCVKVGIYGCIFNGDSGGQLVMSGTNELIGILTHSNIKNCDSNTAVNFTRVSYFRPWINFYLAGLE